MQRKQANSNERKTNVNTDNSLVPINGGNQSLTTPGQPGFGIEGLEGLGQRDIILPRWSIVQPTSQREGAEQHPGEFFRNIDGEFRPSLSVVILQVTPSRLLWSGDRSDTRPECASRDGVTGSVYGPCNACDFNWLVNPALRDNPQAKACSAGYTLLLVDDVAEGTMALFGAMGTSVKPAKILVTQFVQRKRSPFSAVVEFSTELQKNERGKYYVLKPRIGRWLSPEEAAQYRERWLEVKGVVVRGIDEEEPGDVPAGDEPLPF